jgi:hypothetical protein
MQRVSNAVDVAVRASPRWPREKRAATAYLAREDAISLAVDVRCHDPAYVAGRIALLARDDLPRTVAAVIALAAMVPVDRPVSELLAWTDELEESA